MDGPVLKLEVELDGKPSSHELVPGAVLIVGRGETAGLRINRSSVSHEHLKILWTGSELKLSDMGSKFGTYRMPQDSPFKEATLPARSEPLELKIAKSLLRLSWKVDDFVAEPTEVLASTQSRPLERTQVLVEMNEPAVKTPKVTVSRKQTSKKENPSKEATPEEKKYTQPVPQRRLYTRAQAEGALAVLGLTALLVCAKAVVDWTFLGPLIRKIPTPVPGALLDVLVLWIEHLSQRAAVVGVVAVIWVLASIALRKRVLQANSHKTEASSSWRTVRTLAWLGCLVLWAFSFAWPFLWSSARGLPLKRWSESLVLRSLTQAPVASSLPLTDINARIEALKIKESEFQGSSLVYASLLSLQRQRVLAECGGMGDSAWESKKVCLVLLFATAVEAKEQVKPVLLDDISSRVVILLSLDGLTRVLAAEGTQAPLVPFFMESLQMVGLHQERSEIETLLSKAETSDALNKTIETLRELRVLIEKRLIDREKELNYPTSLKVNVPGPLELGI